MGERAAKLLVQPNGSATGKTSRYLPSGHCQMNTFLPTYTPGNGALLSAVAMLVGGWDGDGGKPAPGLDAWTGPTGPVGLALGGRWDELEEGEVCSRIFRSEAKVVQQVVFMYNPNDPFLDAADVERVMGYATRAGYPVRAEHVDDEHVKTLFTSPRKVFGLLQPTDPSLISL